MPYDSTDFPTITKETLLDRDPLTLETPRERLEYLRDFLLKLPRERLNMRQFSLRVGDPEPLDEVVKVNECDTAACICGWTNAIFPGGWGPGDEFHARRMLGLGGDQGMGMFYPPGFFVDDPSVPIDEEKVTSITNVQAAGVIDHYLKTGMVDWGVVGVE